MYKAKCAATIILPTTFYPTIFRANKDLHFKKLNKLSHKKRAHTMAAIPSTYPNYIDL